MYPELIALIINSNTGRLANSIWKTMLGIAVGVGLIIFISSKLDGFVLNMEHYMLGFIPEIQFQRTHNSMPAQLKATDAEKFGELISKDTSILTLGSAYFDISIFQFESALTKINQRCLIIAGLATDGIADDTQPKTSELLLDISKNLLIDGDLATILRDDSNKVVISTKLGRKLFGTDDVLGKVLRIGNRTDDSTQLISVVVGGIYENSSINAIFLAKPIVSRLTKNRLSTWANTFIVRLKDKYKSKTWRQLLIDNLTAQRDEALMHMEMLGEGNIPAKGSPIYDGYMSWKHKFETAKDTLDFLRPFQIQSWMDIAPESLRHLKMTRIVAIVVLFAVLLLTTVSVKFLFETIVIEKKRQLATLKALGFGNFSIMLAFLSAGVFIGTIGMLIGIATGYGLSLLTGQIEANYFELMFEINYLQTNPSIIFITNIGAATLILTLVSAYVPALKAIRIQPIDGIRREG